MWSTCQQHNVIVTDIRTETGDSWQNMFKMLTVTGDTKLSQRNLLIFYYLLLNLLSLLLLKLLNIKIFNIIKYIAYTFKNILNLSNLA